MTGAGPYWPAHTKLVMSGSIRPKAGLQCGGVVSIAADNKSRKIPYGLYRFVLVENKLVL